MSNLWRHDARRDQNESVIVEALKMIGCSIVHLSGVGLPDLLVGYHGVTLLMEVKNKTRLTKSQKLWHGKWTGHVAIVKSPEEAIEVVRDHYDKFQQF